jgi:tetratricopeptide (TPR) repeat protein
MLLILAKVICLNHKRNTNNMIDRILLCLLFLVPFFCMAGDRDFTVEQIIAAHKKAKTIEERAAVALNMTQVSFLEKNDYLIAEHINLLKQGIGQNKPGVINASRLALAANYHSGGNIDRAYLMINEIGNYFYQKDDYENELERLKFLGMILFEKGQHKEALRAFENADKFAKILGENLRTLQLYYLKGSVYYMMGKLDKAEELINKYLLKIKPLKKYGSIADAYGRLGEIKQQKDELDQAEVYYTKGSEYALRGGRSDLAARANINMGIVEFIRGNQSTCLELFEKALEIQRKSGKIKKVCDVLFNIGVFHFDTGNPKAAIPFYVELLKLSDKNGLTTQKHEVLLEFAHLYNILGEKDKSIDYYEQYVQEKDKLSKEIISEDADFNDLNTQLVVQQMRQEHLINSRGLNGIIEKERRKTYLAYGFGILAVVLTVFIFKKTKKNLVNLASGE